MLPSLTPFTYWTPENEQLQGCHPPWAVFQILSVIHWEYQVVLLSEVLWNATEWIWGRGPNSNPKRFVNLLLGKSFLLLISLFVRLGFYLFIFLILLALAGNQLWESHCAQHRLMAWSRSRLPDALALPRGWSLTSVMPSLCDTPGSPLASSAVCSWLACLAANGSSYWAPWSPSGCLHGAQTFSVTELAQPWGQLTCLLLLAVSFWELRHCPEVARSSPVWTRGKGLGESSGG